MVSESHLKIAENLFEGILIHLGQDVGTVHTKDTPWRVIHMYADFLEVGYKEPKFTTFPTDSQEMVLVKDIPFYSLCAHHLLPFSGTVAIVYIPEGELAGLSKLARVVAYFSHRLQVQEELTTQIADYLVARLETENVAVLIEAEHLCMSMRGAQVPGTTTVTTALRGSFRDEIVVRQEFYDMLKV